MILEEVLHDLREVEKGERLMHRPLAGKAADTIEMLVEKNRYLEEKNEKLEQMLTAEEACRRHLEDELGY